jgi:hypothetical protein
MPDRRRPDEGSDRLSRAGMGTAGLNGDIHSPMRKAEAGMIANGTPANLLQAVS